MNNRKVEAAMLLSHTTTTLDSSSEVQVVSEVGQHDVIMGRGAPATDNAGNVRYRMLVESRREEYVQTKRRHEKDRIAREIIASVHRRGGRFLRKLEDDARKPVDECGASLERSIWVPEDGEHVVAKVKQTIRDLGTSKKILRRKMKSSTSEKGRTSLPSPQMSLPSEISVSAQSADEKSVSPEKHSWSPKQTKGLAAYQNLTSLSAIVGDATPLINPRIVERDFHMALPKLPPRAQTWPNRDETRLVVDRFMLSGEAQRAREQSVQVSSIHLGQMAGPQTTLFYSQRRQLETARLVSMLTGDTSMYGLSKDIFSASQKTALLETEPFHL